MHRVRQIVQKLDAVKEANGLLKVFLAALIFLMLAMLATLYCQQNRPSPMPNPQGGTRAPS